MHMMPLYLSGTRFLIFFLLYNFRHIDYEVLELSASVWIVDVHCVFWVGRRWRVTGAHPSHYKTLSESLHSFLSSSFFRYTFFIVLYPMGASGELFTMLAALSEVSSVAGVLR